MTEQNYDYMASKLLAKGLRLSSNPFRDKEYANLLQVVQSDHVFSEKVIQIAKGFGLLVLDISDDGIILTPDSPESLFCMKMSDYRKSLGKGNIDIRSSTFLFALLSVCTTFFPNASDINDDEFALQTSATLDEIAKVMLDTCKKFVNQEDEQDVPEEYQSVARRILAMPVILESKRARSIKSIHGLLHMIVNHMVDNKLLDKEEREKGPLYFPTNRYLSMLRYRAAGGVYEIMQFAQNPREEKEETGA